MTGCSRDVLVYRTEVIVHTSKLTKLTHHLHLRNGLKYFERDRGNPHRTLLTEVHKHLQRLRNAMHSKQPASLNVECQAVWRIKPSVRRPFHHSAYAGLIEPTSPPYLGGWVRRYKGVNLVLAMCFISGSSLYMKRYGVDSGQYTIWEWTIDG